MARMSNARLLGVWLPSTLALVGGCYRGAGARVEDAAETGDTTGAAESGGVDDGDPLACATPQPGRSPLRRLSAFEYDNTIADLLGDDSRPAQALPAEGAGGFDNNADAASAGRLVVEGYMAAAEAVAARAVERLDELLQCPTDTPDAACVGAWIDAFVPRAWRRPLTPDERADLSSFFDDANAQWGLEAGVALLLQRVLQSPHFLYRVEFGVDDPTTSLRQLTDHEMASRLSYLFWGSMPDEHARELADAASLHTDAQIEAEAQRMLADARSRRTVLHFHAQWLGYARLEDLDKDPATFPDYTPAIATAQRAEIDAFIGSVVFEGDATLRSLLTAPYTMIDEPLAGYYGLELSPGAGVRQASGTDREVSGLMTQGAILAVAAKPTETHPIARGLFVREQLLCQIPPPPPPGVALEPPPADPEASTRERYERHRSDPACEGCHQLIDPIGFGFENFDATGRWRTSDNGIAIDASGALHDTDVDGPFTGPSELGAKLADSDQVLACMATQWFRYGYGRTETPDQDGCSLSVLEDSLVTSGGDVRELLLALTRTDAFRYRPVDEGGQ